MTIGDLVCSYQFDFDARFRIVSYKRITDEVITMFDSLASDIVPKELRGNEITCINTGKDNVLEIECDSDDETVDTMTLLSQAYTMALGIEWERETQGQYDGQSFECVKVLDANFAFANHGYVPDDDDFKVTLEQEKYGRVSAIFTYDSRTEHDIYCGTILAEGSTIEATFRSIGALAGIVLSNVNHHAHAIQRGDY